MTRSSQLTWLAGLLILVGVSRIAATYRVYNQTFDEPTHIGGGLEALDRGTYRLDVRHTPLARTLIAVGPYLDGARLTGSTDPYAEGNAALYDRGSYYRTLTLARLGILPLFIGAALVMFLWTRAQFGSATAVVALFLFTTLPSILGHSAIATTDMSITATTFGAVVAFGWWLAAPSWRRSVVVGVALALALLSKISAVVLFPACALCYGASHLISRWATRNTAGVGAHRASVSQWLQYAGLIGATAALGLWAGYRFTMHPLLDAPDFVPIQSIVDRVAGASGWLHDVANAVVRFPYFPAPDFVTTFLAASLDTVHGRPSYLLGNIREGGWWYFFPVAIAVKTPIPFLLLFAAGAIGILRRIREKGEHALAMLLCAGTILFLSLQTHVQIGLRHILPIMPFMAVVAALGVGDLWNVARGRAIGRGMVAILLVWQLYAGVRAHPDYLPYFNEFASRNPEHFLMDSDLDWGQDLDRLGNELRKRGIDTVRLSYFGTARPARHLSAVIEQATSETRQPGWLAISAYDRYGIHAKFFRWLNPADRITKVGKSMELYYIPRPSPPGSLTVDLDKP